MDGAMVRGWRDADLDSMCADARLLAFDLDNTLARSRQPMSEAMAWSIATLSRHIELAIVTGGSWDLVERQVLAMLEGTGARYGSIHIMPTSGSHYYRWSPQGWRPVYVRNLPGDVRDRVVAALERCARQQGVWLEEVRGPRIEDRGGQITFSALGQLATLQEKESWDRDDMRKARLVEAVSRELPDLQVRSGGLTSVDVSLRGMDKSYAVRALAQQLRIPVARMLFVGDRMDPGGNDRPVVRAGAMALRVRDPEDTVALCGELVKRIASVV